jgi:hypothetical protein
VWCCTMVSSRGLPVLPQLVHLLTGSADCCRTQLVVAWGVVP